MIIGYARVSTQGQSTRNQVEELLAAGCEDVVHETASGAHGARPRLKQLLAKLNPGDILIVTRLDRLARSTVDLLNTLKAISDRGAAFRSIHDHWADSSSAHGRLMITVLGSLAEFERELMIARTAEGRAAAMDRGVRFGRKPVLSRNQVSWVAMQRRQGATCRDLARILDVHWSTISRIPPAADDAPPVAWRPKHLVDEN